MSRASIVCVLAATLVGLGCSKKSATEPGSEADDPTTNNSAPDASAAGGDGSEDASVTPSEPDIVPRDGPTSPDLENPGPGFDLWRDEVQSALAESCGGCHLGERFGMASLKRAGAEFTPEETEENYLTFFGMLSLDNPVHSRLLVKGLAETEAEAIHHGAGAQFEKTDPLYAQLLNWAETEKETYCSDCGTTAPVAYIAYLQSPAINWMLEESPTRTDRGERSGAKIILHRIDPATLGPIGEPIDFLGSNFCPEGNDCDYGALAASHDGTKLAFECRISVAGESWLNRSWNLCLAEIGEDGTAQDARFLKPEGERFFGTTTTRTTPFGIVDSPDGENPVSPYNKHYLLRQRNDRHPQFSPGDGRLYFSSQGPDPRTGDDMVESYHGSFHLKHLVSSNLDGTDLRTVMRNEGGTVDFPFFLQNGNIAAHVWNLERMDRHMYAQATADGMMELPILLGRKQGPNMWGKAFQMVNGLIVGMTGRRRGELENYAPFVGDHTVGIQGVDPDLEGFQGFRLIDEAYLNEIADYPDGYCPNDIDGPTAASTENCHISKLILDASWTPHQRALVAFNAEKTYIGMGESFVANYAQGASVEERQAYAEPYLPQAMGVALYDLEGNAETLLPNAPGTFSRFPTWVGKRQPPRIQEPRTDESQNFAELHIANVPIWLTFGMNDNGQGSKTGRLQTTSETVALRILRKVSDKNACISDGRYIQMSNVSSNGLHPTALGLIDSTGFEQYRVPQAVGGDAYGDVPLKADGSVRVRVPAGQLLWFVGIDEGGFISAHRQRVSALPPGHSVDAGVKAEYYDSQCARCHGSIGGATLAEVRDLSNQPAVLEFDTDASAAPPVDLTDEAVQTRLLTYRSLLNPIFQEHCTEGCHTGEDAAGELSLDATYSSVGNYPKGSWVDSAWDTYVAHMDALSAEDRAPSYNFSVTYDFLFRSDNQNYQDFYASRMSTHEPLGELAPWEPGYQNLLLKRHYVNARDNVTQVGRVPQEGGNARSSFLLEVLTDIDLDPTNDYAGAFDHTELLSQADIRSVAAVLDAGFPYTARCDDKVIPSGTKAGGGWGQPISTPE
jgi:hypothetical protein